MCAHRARLKTNESFTVTTGPSSGHSESWFCPQSSHPAGRRVTCNIMPCTNKDTAKKLTSGNKDTIMFHAYS